MFKRLAAGLLLRKLSKDFARIADGLDRQTALLARLADRYAPIDPPTDRASVKADTGVSHLDHDDAARALAYVERTVRDTGHYPDDDEVLIYLADEKTVDLQTRLAARDQELARLAEERA
jgi:hypothetical protein